MALAPQHSPGQSVSLSKVPSVRHLCDLLGIQHASLKESTIFMDAIHAWRKSSITSDGWPLTTLLDWNSPSVQEELRSAAVMFLEGAGGGHRFWTPTRSWAQPSDLHYPQHRDRIIELLVQLFWKQNRYLHNNSYYSSKAPGSHSRDASADQSTQNVVSPSTTSAQPPQNKKNENKKPTALAGPAEFEAELSAFSTDFAATPLRSGDDDVPPQTYAPAQTSKHSRDERPDSEIEARKKKKKRQVEDSPRRTERRRNPRKLPGVAPQEEVNMILDMEENEAEAMIDTLILLSSGPKTQLSDTTLDLQPRAISALEESAHPTSNKNNPRDSAFAAPIAPMILNQRPPAPKPSLLTKQPAPLTKVIRLKIPPSNRLGQTTKTLPPKSTAGVQATTSHSKMQKAALGGIASSGPESSSDRRQHLSAPISAQSSWKMASVSSDNDKEKAGVFLGSVEEDSELSSLSPVDRSLPLLDSSLSPIDSYIGPPGKPVRPSLKSAATSNVARDMPSLPKRSITSEQSTVSQISIQSGASVPRPRIQIPFWIITRDPIYTEELWNDGKFQGLPLADFLEGITKVTQRSHIEKIKLTLRTPFSNTILTVYGDAEDAWTTAKATFAEKLKESRAEARAKRVDDSGGYKILIEPFYEQVIVTGGGTEADDDVFDY